MGFIAHAINVTSLAANFGAPTQPFHVVYLSGHKKLPGVS